MKVLTVDDLNIQRVLVRAALASKGITVLEAANGREALEIARCERPDAILLDHRMPVMDGRETLEQLKSDPATKDIPVIMLTTTKSRGDVVSLLKLGLAGYLVKPFHRRDLFSHLNDATGGALEALVPASAGKPAATPVGGRMSVLAAVGEQPLAETLEKHFAEGFAFSVAGTGAEALEVIAKEPPDVLILNLDLTETSGIDVFRETAAALKDKGTIVYGVAPRGNDEEIEKAREAGIDKMLLQPFEDGEIEAVLETIREAGKRESPGDS